MRLGGFDWPLALLVVALFLALIALFQWLWNATLPEVFGLKRITYWQALRLMALAALLFGWVGWLG